MLARNALIRDLEITADNTVPWVEKHAVSSETEAVIHGTGRR